MFKRDERGRVVVTITDPDGGIDMEIVNGGVYRFGNDEYRATIEESELAVGTLASFQRLPITQEDDEPSIFLDRNDGSIGDDTGTNVGDYRDLEYLR